MVTWMDGSARHQYKKPCFRDPSFGESSRAVSKGEHTEVLLHACLGAYLD